MSQWVRGRRLGLDVGLARIGVAQCDPDGILATPLTTISVLDGPQAGWERELQALWDLCEEHMITGVVVGLPSTLKGKDSTSTAHARTVAQGIGDSIAQRPLPTGDCEVLLHDERLSTVSASAALRASGKNAKKQKKIIDEAAAVVILQSWLDRVKNSGLNT